MKILALACFCVDVFPESGKILPGGNALNLAVNCTAIKNTEVFVMGNIGQDNYASIIKKSIDAYKINRLNLYEVKGQTANHIIHIDETGDRYFKENSWTSGVWADYKMSVHDKKIIKDMDAVATTYYEPDFKNIIKAVSNRKFIMCVDFHDEKIKLSWEKYFKYIDLFFISGNGQNLDILKKWSEKYNTIFTATLGKYGSISYQKGKKYVCKAIKPKKVVDTTGCGDSYQAGFIMEYLSSKDIKKSMIKGSKSAANTLSFIGGFKI